MLKKKSICLKYHYFWGFCKGLHKLLYLPLFVWYIWCLEGRIKKSGWPQLGFKNQKNYLRSVDRPWKKIRCPHNKVSTKNSKGEWTLSRTRLAWWLVETAALVRPRSGWGGSRDQPPGQSSPWQGPRAFTIFGRDFVVRIPDFFSWSVNRPQVIFLVFEA